MLKIHAIYDNGGKTLDRYSILVEKHSRFITPKQSGDNMYDCLGLSNRPESPLGFSQWTTAQDGKHLGKQIAWNDLPENVQEHLLNRLK